jgi:late competence protein required for DNA uptake (superfamily II DNA/RNA helicase)
MELPVNDQLFTCERCGVVCTEECFITPKGKLLCPPCLMLKDNVDRKSLAAVTQAKTLAEKVEAWMNANGILQDKKEGRDK